MEIEITDAILYVRKHRNEFDVVIVDSTDPIGPGVGLFTKEFYQDVYKALKDGGLMVAQTESPVNNKELVQKIHRTLQEVFPLVRLYLGPVPTYPSGLWSYTLASKGPDPVAARREVFGFGDQILHAGGSPGGSCPAPVYPGVAGLNLLTICAAGCPRWPWVSLWQAIG